MGDFFIKKTFNTPEIQIIASEGTIRIEGRSIPEDPGDFFERIIQQVNEYYHQPQILTKIDIKLEYVNSGSSKFLLEILRIIRRNYESGHDCIVNWYFEEDDESIQELGIHYQNTLKIPFRLIDYF